MPMGPDPGKQPSSPALVTVAVTSRADVMKCPDKKTRKGLKGFGSQFNDAVHPGREVRAAGVQGGWSR